MRLVGRRKSAPPRRVAAAGRRRREKAWALRLAQTEGHERQARPGGAKQMADVLVPRWWKRLSDGGGALSGRRERRSRSLAAAHSLFVVVLGVVDKPSVYVAHRLSMSSARPLISWAVVGTHAPVSDCPYARRVPFAIVFAR
uniref:Uncharacterized protein n=1 Tax=Plectus sambesii TaxID=2011161 RepID=A0A914WMB1_9BILA